jgi:hypothetical protein
MSINENNCEGCMLQPAKEGESFSGHCGECSRFFPDRFYPSKKAKEEHSTKLKEESTINQITSNQTGPGYYVGDQTDPEGLAWVLSLREASEMLIELTID